MRSQAGLGGGILAGTQQRNATLPGSPTQQTLKGLNKTAKGTTRPMGATLPVRACIAMHNHALPCLPCLAFLALPCLALPSLPCLALPCLALPCLALPCFVLPGSALYCIACRGIACYPCCRLSGIHLLWRWSSGHKTFPAALTTMGSRHHRFPAQTELATCKVVLARAD